MAYDPNDPADKALVDGLIADAVQEANEAHEAVVEGLKAENFKAREKLRLAREGKGGDNTAEVERLERELDESQAKLTDAERVARENKRELDKAQKIIATAQETAEAESAFSRNLIVENDLTKALLEANVAPQFVEAAKAMLGKAATVKTDGDNRVAVVGDKALAEYVKEWAGSDAGKHFVAAPANGGGGSGGQGQGSGSTKKLADMTEGERLEMSRTNPIGWKALLDSEGPKENALSA